MQAHNLKGEQINNHQPVKSVTLLVEHSDTNNVPELIEVKKRPDLFPHTKISWTEISRTNSRDKRLIYWKKVAFFPQVKTTFR